jgi:hypothetical protein
MVIARFDEAGKWVEGWNSWDQLGMLRHPAQSYRSESQELGIVTR